MLGTVRRHLPLLESRVAKSVSCFAEFRLEELLDFRDYLKCGFEGYQNRVKENYRHQASLEVLMRHLQESLFRVALMGEELVLSRQEQTYLYSHVNSHYGFGHEDHQQQ
jgi:hypothetical protein